MAMGIDERIETLQRRVESSLEQAHAWIPRSTSGPAPHSPAPALVRELEQTRARLHRAEGSASLQAQRCTALEDRVVELELLLDREARARQESDARALEAHGAAVSAARELEAARKQPGPSPSSGASLEISRAFQEKLLEVEQLTRQRDTLKRSSDEWRSKARILQRERDELLEKNDRAQAQLLDHRARDESSRKRIEDLERLTTDQSRELETAERRTQHLRQRLSGTNASR